MEIIEMREMGTVKERLHDEDGVKNEHTHTQRKRGIMGASSRNVSRPGASSWIASSRNEGREYAPLKWIVTR